MRLLRLPVLFMTVVLMAGCISPHATIPPRDGLVLRNYPRVKIVLKDKVDTAFSREIGLLFIGLLEGKLRTLDMQPVEEGEDMRLVLTLLICNPGDLSKKLLIGFGAGRSQLKYRATFYVKDRIIAELEGGEFFSGIMAAEDEKMALVQRSVTQIGEFIDKNGLPDKSRAATWQGEND